MYIDKNTSNKIPVKLTNYMYTSNIKYNLYSIPYAISIGAKATIKNGYIVIMKDKVKIKFDMKLKSGSSYLMCAKMIP